MDLNTELIGALFSLILIFVYVSIGLKTVSKYFIVKQKIFLYLGISWIILSMVWWSSVLNVFLIVIDPSSGGLSAELYFLISSLFLPVGLYLFVTVITNLKYEKSQKYLQILVIIIGGLFEIIGFYFIFTDPSMLLKKDGLYVENSYFIIIFYIIFISIMEILGFLFSITSIKSNDPVVRLKGKLLTIALILFPVGSMMDAMTVPALLDFLDRIILIFAVIFFYLGFVMPNWMKNHIIKRN